MRRVLAILLASMMGIVPALAQDTQTLLHLLDYIAVDYAGAVEDGKVKNADEYAEMLEFTTRVGERIERFEDGPRKAALSAQARQLAELVRDKAMPTTVAAAASQLRSGLIGAYDVELAPRTPPSLELGAALYAQHCAKCHGPQGNGDGPAALGLDPRPSNFHDLQRMAQRSAYGLYNTVTLSVDGTDMASFRQLTEQERWALAFFVARLGVSAARVTEGEKLWAQGEARGAFTDLESVATLSRQEILQRHGERAALVHDYLLASPQALQAEPLSFARQKITAAFDSYHKGDRAAAREAALAAYLEGFELVEANLANLDAKLMREIEQAMLELRAAIEQGVPETTLAQHVARVDALLATAQEKMSAGMLSASAAFATSLLILLREGLEAILVLAAIIAFVAKTGRRDALPWVHAGWIMALALGALTWLVATYFVQISGANRELTEGVSALLAAAMLLYVGYWLHGKSYAEAWTRFIREHVGEALARRTLWAMAAVSFLAVYREMFEIVLFYQALWLQAGTATRGAVLWGIGVAAALLGAIGFTIFKYSLRLPIGPFFAAASLLLALLAIVFTGHGIAALQEAGLIGSTRFGFNAIPVLGLYPSSETLCAQAVALVLVALAFLVARRQAGATDLGRD